MKATKTPQIRAGGHQMPCRTTWPGFGSQVKHQGIGKKVSGYLQDEAPLISCVML